MENPIKMLERYLPVAVSELPLHGEGGLLRFTSIVTDQNLDVEDCYLWHFQNHEPKILAYLERPVLDRNDVLIRELFSTDSKELVQEILSLKASGWRGSTVCMYGQAWHMDEDRVHFYTHYFLPQVFQSELDKRKFKPTDKLIVGEVTDRQAKDFEARKEQLAKLFRGTGE